MNRPSSSTEVVFDSDPQSLYARREKIYPREVHGTFATLRVTAVLALLGLFYGVPWLSWDAQQLLLFDLPARKFHIFGLVFFPQDFLYLTFMMILAALALFFFTALAGRLWCGYACPQTVWTEVFLWIERKIEGNRLNQVKLDKLPWGGKKLTRKGLKHTVWILFSLWTGFTFVGYFTPILELGARVVTFELSGWETFWVLFYGFATYGNAGWMREQVCIYMCPYARFQSAMFDADTLIISYDEARGDPRGSRKRGVDPKEQGLGDCIDCTMCVQVCPTGIDIRNGLQYQCIGCAACVDVCDQVMDKMGYAKGLVSYTTENAVRGKSTHVLRPRIFVYCGGLIVLCILLAISVFGRNPLEVDVMRDRNALYRTTDAGLIENIYTIRIVNKDTDAHLLSVSVRTDDAIPFQLDSPTVELAGGEIKSIVAKLRIAPEALAKRTTSVQFVVTSENDEEVGLTTEARFLGPEE